MSSEKERAWMARMEDWAVYQECSPEFESECSPVDMFEHHLEQAIHDQEAAEELRARSWPHARSWSQTALWHKLAAEEQRRRLAIYQHDEEAKGRC